MKHRISIILEFFFYHLKYDLLYISPSGDAQVLYVYIHKGWIKSNGTSWIFLTWLHEQRYNIYLPSNLCAKYLEGAVHHQRVRLCWFSVLTALCMDKFISCVVPNSSQCFFHFTEEIVISWTQEKTTTLGDTEPNILHVNVKNHTAVVTDLLRRWKWEILQHSP